jgi:hypothetical protein
MPRIGPQFVHGPRSSFGQQISMPHNRTFQQMLLPKIFYLFTSLNSKYEPYWSQNPVSLAGNQTRPNLDRGYTYRIGL